MNEVPDYRSPESGGAYDSTQTPATNYFQDLSLVKYVAVSSFYVITTCAGDGFMVGIKSALVSRITQSLTAHTDIPSLDRMGTQLYDRSFSYPDGTGVVWYVRSF